MNAIATPAMDQDLITNKRTPPKPNTEAPGEEGPNLRRRVMLRQLLRTSLYALVAIAAFLLFLLPKLPYELLASDALNYLSLHTPYVWKSSSVQTSFLFGPKVEFSKLTLTSKPFGYGSGDPQQITLDSLKIAPQLLTSMPIPGLKPLSPSTSFALKAFQGEAAGSVTAAGDDLSLSLQGEKFSLEKMATAFQMANLDPKGSIQTLGLELNIPQGKASRANGDVQLKLKGLQIDLGGLNLGMPIPILSLGDVVVNGALKNGKLTLSKTQIGGPTNDAEATIDGTITLREPLEFSDMDLKIHLRFAQKIIQVMPFIDSFFGAGKRPDGFYGLRLQGNLMNPGMPRPDPTI